MDNPPCRRRRPAVACTECRRRKIRCDRVSPCGPCSKSALRCVYNHLLPKSGPEAQPQPVESPSPGAASGLLRPNTSMFNKYFMEDPTNPMMLDLPEDLMRLDSPGHITPASSENSWDQVDWWELLSSENDVLCPVPDDLRNMWKRCRELEYSLSQVQLPLEWLNWSPGWMSVSSLVPPKTTCDVLVESYVNTFESVFRILHIPSFLREYREYWNSPDSATDIFLWKLLLVMAIGTCFTCGTPDHVSSMQLQASSWIFYGQEWLSKKIEERSEWSVDLLQTGCLLLISRQACGTGHRRALISEDCLVRLAMQLGLHQEPRMHTPAMLGTEAEIRRRLWVTLVELSLQASLDAGLPAPLSPDDFDTELPGNYTDSDLSGLEPSSPSKPRDVFTHSTIQILLAETQQIRYRILKCLHSPGTSLTYHETLQLASEFTRSCNSQLKRLQSFSRSSGTVTPTEFQIKLVDTCTRRFLLALLSPYADQARSNYSFYYTRKARMEASALLLSYPLSHDSYPPLSDDQYSQLQVFGDGILQSVLRQATSAACRDLIDDMIEDAFTLTDREARTKLCKAVQTSIAMYRRRVQNARSSTREYVAFLCAAQQIDAIHNQHDSGNAVVLAMKKGLETCSASLEAAHQHRSVENAMTSTLPTLDCDPDIDLWADFMAASNVSANCVPQV
ncbi:hypothetical protein BDV25DRAFT_168905 [Aspergillus avenaceus]|uniref:Zn(2)-C6 fungal-type domain-containing protein n=1 Tax=Aspergillus avenaceus TaxID=36643 RepID=A0A5N6U4V6_ASPAV|nr:hypothetical protein BDV25DRAFT_168905 [Aspergillus avenaceus]